MAGSRKISQAKLDKAIVMYISQSVLPFNHVESEAFHSHVQNLVTNWEEYKKALIHEMSKASVVWLTIDHWSCRSKGYVGFTAHWLTGQQRQQGAIALRCITQRCTHDVLADIIHNVIDEYGIEGKVSHCVTDSWSIFVKAFKVCSSCCVLFSHINEPMFVILMLHMLFRCLVKNSRIRMRRKLQMSLVWSTLMNCQLQRSIICWNQIQMLLYKAYHLTSDAVLTDWIWLLRKTQKVPYATQSARNL